MAILGLLIERPGQTVAEVAQGLEKRFAMSRFDQATAYNTLPQMARSGLSRPRVRCTHHAPGRGRGQDRYEPTPVGIQDFRAWMYAVPSGSGPPALREALYGRIELCTLEDLPELIRIAREEASIAKDLYSAASTRLKRHKQVVRDQVHEGLAPKNDYLQEVRQVLLLATPQHWAARQSLMEEIRLHLERIAKKAGIAFTVPR
jgi:DNA-binding PadR family transcriptional regulator